ncbi:hypothetical protein MAPG_08930 [Magnaporthiopsis poae ATCC 64411]|uniref:Small ribosomal subunit protein bS18m n=1 Tax=Magnaporthiopsis poae (strain ATCC 64411 / 73-15) TaxID=644358 RepID=A0A0C4E8M1_MAGP6|nr:hypothetical protein MAPG_08930 [Magnaporthiopsis poae ATCC 64411]
MPPPKLYLPSLASQCRSLLSRPAAASTRFISTTAPKAAPGTSSTPFSPAQLLEGLDGSSSPSSSRNNNSNNNTTPGAGGLRPNSNFWSSGGPRNNNNNRFNRFNNNNNNSNNRNPTTASSAVGDALAGMLAEPSTREAHRTLRKAQTKAEASASLRKEDQSNAYMRQMPRRWTAGEVYAPHDLSPEEIQRYFRREIRPRFDVFDVLGFNPLDNYSNFSVISEYMTPMGRIKHRDETGLRPVNHRKMAKAIRRAIGLGLHPSVHRHPEILRRLRRSVPGRAKFDH